MKLLTVTVSIVAALCVPARAAMTRRSESVPQPHIVVIIADDLGWNDLSFHGSDQIPTPNIDALAYNGVILQRHYVLPICTPSRTAFLTGRYAIRSGMQGTPLSAGEPRAIPLSETLFPEHLRRLGYATRIVGKWHVGYYTEDHTPSRRGFDSFFGYYCGYITYFNHTIDANNHTGFDLHRDTAGEPLLTEYNATYMTDLITENAEDVIARHNASQPLYLQVSHLAVHTGGEKEPLEVRSVEEMNSALGYIEHMERRKYAAMLTSMDESVGRVVTALSDAGMLENSIILFIADNGAPTVGPMANTGSNYPLRGIKETLFEGGVRGAACLWSPLIKNASRISDELIHITDWMPTFYSAAGGDPADLGEIDGVDQWSALVNSEKSPRKSLLVNIDESINSKAAIIGRYKLIEGAPATYAHYYGESGEGDSYPPYNATAILSSPTSLAIAGLTSSVELTVDGITELRAAAKVNCTRPDTYSNCTEQCLFDIVDDPCETTDVSSRHPLMVSSLKAMIYYYEMVLMNQTNAPVDPASYPDNFGGFWMPWMKEEILTDNRPSSATNFAAKLDYILQFAASFLHLLQLV